MGERLGRRKDRTRVSSNAVFPLFSSKFTRATLLLNR